MAVNDQIFEKQEFLTLNQGLIQSFRFLLKLQDIFGVNSVAAVNVEANELPELNNPISVRVSEIVQLVRAERPRFMRTVFVRQREKLDILFRYAFFTVFVNVIRCLT